MKVSGNFASGDLHELVYKREGSNMYLTVSTKCTREQNDTLIAVAIYFLSKSMQTLI